MLVGRGVGAALFLAAWGADVLWALGVSVERESSMCGNARERSNSETLEIAYLHMCRQYMCVCVCVCVCVSQWFVCVCEI